MLSLIMGIATAFNILIIFKKIELKRFQDAFFDGGLLILLTLVFGGSLGGMMVATVASAVISLYFLFNQPNLFEAFKSNDAKESTETVEDILAKYKLDLNIKDM